MTPSNAPTTLDTSAALVSPPRGRALSAGLQPPAGTRSVLPKGWVVAGVLGLAGVATAAFFAGQHSAPASAPTVVSVPATQAVALPNPAAPVAPTPAPATTEAVAHTAPAHPATHVKHAATQTPRPDAGTGSGAAPVSPVAETHADAARPAAPVCANCGVVESVQAVQQKGQGTGVGAVAGGVLGGVLGSQMGKGNGRTAMTVLGAIGGGLAGNEVEKRSKAVTVYRVQVRTDDGELRTVQQSTAPAVGARVRVDGQQLHAISP